jgi:hypothetical protein
VGVPVLADAIGRDVRIGRRFLADVGFRMRVLAEASAHRGQIFVGTPANDAADPLGSKPN